MPRSVNHYIQTGCKHCLAVCAVAQALCGGCLTVFGVASPAPATPHTLCHAINLSKHLQGQRKCRVRRRHATINRTLQQRFLDLVTGHVIIGGGF